MSVLGECTSQDVQTLGLHGYDGTGKEEHMMISFSLQLPLKSVVVVVVFILKVYDFSLCSKWVQELHFCLRKRG